MSLTGGGYRTVLRTPGLARPSAAGVAAGIAAQGMPVALVLLGREATGSFARAGALLAAATVGGLALSPARARLVDRRGATRTLPALAIGSTTGLVALVVASDAHAPLALLVALAFGAAVCTPPIGAVMRSLWRDLLPEGAARHAGFGLMTVLQEVTFFTGPLVAGATVGLASARAAVVALALLGLAAALAFAGSPAVRAHAGTREADGGRSWLGALAMPGMRTLAATGGLAGAAFGILDVALVPRRMATEAVAVLGVAYGACSAVGAQAAGALVDGGGLRAPFVAALGCAAAGWAIGTARRRTLLGARATIATP